MKPKKSRFFLQLHLTKQASLSHTKADFHKTLTTCCVEVLVPLVKTLHTVPSKLKGKCSRLLATAREHLEQVHCIGIVREPVIEDARIDRESQMRVSLASLSERELVLSTARDCLDHLSFTALPYAMRLLEVIASSPEQSITFPLSFWTGL